MKKIFYSTVFGILATAMLFTACTEKYEYTPASNNDGGNVFIVGNAYNVLGYEGNAPLAFKIKLQRSNEKIKENVTLVSDNDAVKIPHITFEAGEKTKEVEIPFNSPEASTIKVNVSVKPENASHYGLIKATYILEHYKVYTADYQSQWVNNTFNGLKLYEAGNKHFMIKIPLKGLDQKDFYPIRFEVNEKNEVYVHPQPIYTDKDGDGKPHLLHIIGNYDMKACDGQNGIFKKADIDKHNHLAGMYNPQEKTFNLVIFWYAPDFGWWNFSHENIAIAE